MEDQNNKTKLYYLLQFLGWGVYVGLVGYSIQSKTNVGITLGLFLAGLFLFNISISHCYRLIIISFDWVKNKLGIVLLKIIVSSIVLALLFSVTTNFLNFLINEAEWIWLDSNTVSIGFFLYLIWSVIYFAYAYRDRSKSQELKNVKLEALKNEIELQNLRSQLNPHFMFNAMNSIRALVDENPKQAKQAITQLSSILRNALIHSKDKLVSLKEEMNIVEAYLSLEKIRYEERLKVNINIDKQHEQIKLPPLLLQTLVENGIKHGIAKRIKGGEITINSSLIENKLHLVITNSGTLALKKKSETGVGIENTKKRLLLEYGNKAKFTLSEGKNETVITTLQIPTT